MAWTWGACAVLAALVIVTVARVAWKQRIAAQSKRTFREYEQRVKAVATEVTILGTALGTGRRLYHVVEVVSAGFDLRRSDGTLVTVAAGVTVNLYASAARVDGDAVTVPEGTRLLYLPREAAPADAPYKTAGGDAYTRGDELMLFSADATLFAMPFRQRRTSVPTIILLPVVAAATCVMCVLYGPNTRWNALLFVQLIALVIDQVLARGILSWGLCTREPPPLSAGPRAAGM